jgi:hypothetical protein
VATLAGCAGVPDSGPLHLGRPVAPAGGGLTDATVREVPAGPLPGASRVELVTGFLRAMIDSDDDYGVARSYLAPGTTWNTSPGLTVYADPARVAKGPSGAVMMRAKRLGTIGPRGAFRVAAGSVTEQFGFARRGGQWRINRLAPGVLLSANDAERLLQPASLYFLTPDGRRVVPEPVLEPPQEPGLATTLMRALLSGPGPSVAPALRTAIPHGTSLLGNVPISTDGVAEVDLSANARQVTPAQLARLSAQVVWTLRQLTSVSAVRLLVNGDALTAPGVPALQPVHSWPQFDPAVPPASTGSLLVRRGRVIGSGTTVPRALAGSGLSYAVRDSDGTSVAAVRGNGTVRELVTGPATAAAVTVRLRAVGLTNPSFAPDGRLFVAAGEALYAVPRNGPALPVALPDDLAGTSIRAVAVSRDGARVAMALANGSLVVAMVSGTAAHPSLRASRRVLPAADHASGVAWVNAGELVTTIARDGRRDVVEVGLDGFQMQSLSAPGMPGDLDRVAASPGQHVLASGPVGTWQLVGHRWGRLSTGTKPSYAGG